ncbi:hypothetical protein QL104_11950 [Pseudomonas piscis]|uniref:Autotransporter n=1 Tax=Pseudomonas piscis TaxID=2614538 RepID=A0ABY9NNB1_9PSED|nr:hypothetical protein [Pseudomonas piscis]WMN20064.1 hypothetical protein QL104_11950 [Pseudomonas piscis]
MNARAKDVLVSLSPLPLAIRLGLAGLLWGLASPAAMAACSPANPSAGSIVTCSGNATAVLTNAFATSADDLTVNVNSGATFNSLLGGTAMSLTGHNVTLNNSGTIDPALLGLVTLLSNGAVIGNGSAATVNINNAAWGMRWTLQA